MLSLMQFNYQFLVVIHQMTSYLIEKVTNDLFVIYSSNKTYLLSKIHICLLSGA